MLALPPITLYVFIGALGVICLLLLFFLSRRGREAALWQEQLQNQIKDYNLLVERFDLLGAEKNSLEQQKIKAETQTEGLQIRLNERDEKITYLQQELDEEQRRHDVAVGQLNQLKERIGIATTQAENLQNQLQQSQLQLERKETAHQQTLQQAISLEQQLTELKTRLTEKELHFAEQQQAFSESKQQLTTEFQNLANRILEEKSRSFNQTNQNALETLLKPFREQIDGFQKRVNEIHSESLKGNAGLEAEIKKVLEIGISMSQEANNLTSALKGEKKTLGNWGEVQLERTLQLAGLMEDVHYSAQAHFKDQAGGRNYPDFVVHLPDDKQLIIDSKMSLVAYENAVSANDEQTAQQYLREHIKALKAHIEDLSRKDYSNLIGIKSPNFVLMFIAVEPAYIEALKADPSLFAYGYERNVVMVSHTTLMPILRTVANLWRIERGNEEAKEIADLAGEIYNQICLVAERLSKLGNTLVTATNQYNGAVTALAGQQGLAGKAERFKALSAKANKNMPALEPLSNEVDLARLSALDTNNAS